MASFTNYFVPTVSASVDANDTEIGIETPPYDGSLESDWTNAGTNTRLQAIDSNYVSWATAALGTSSRRLDLSSFVVEGGTDSIATTIPVTATVTAVTIDMDGDLDCSSLDLTSVSTFAGLRQQAAGGIFTPANSGETQYIDVSNLSNGGSGVGTYPFSFSMSPAASLGGLSAANMLTMLRTSTFLMRSFFLNDTATLFTVLMDRVRLRVDWDSAASAVGNLRTRSNWRSRVR